MSEHSVRVYVSGPLSADDQVANVRRACELGVRIARAGHYPYVPHLSWFLGLVADLTYEEYIRQDLEWLRQCHAVIRIPGESPGAEVEAREARRMGIPVVDEEEFFACMAFGKWVKERSRG